MFIPGTHVKTVNSKKGNEILIRYPRWEDLHQMTQYINMMSKEDTFITFSGEDVSLEEEAKFLTSVFVDIELHNKVKLCAFHNHKLIGISDVTRNNTSRERGKHIGIFGLSVAQEYRGDGVGYLLAKAVLEESRRHISGLNTVILDVYGKNDIARNLYKKLGFKEYGALPEGLLYRGEFIDDIKMYLPLEQDITSLT
jgi:RimJ/RimL family protein N-acetyltransferase